MGQVAGGGFQKNDRRRSEKRMTIRIPDLKHQRLRLLAERAGVSLNKLVDGMGQHGARTI